MKRICAIVLVAGMAACLGGCSEGEEFPLGAYVSTADVNNLGPVTSTYKDDGTMTVEQGPTVVDGTFEVEGDQITLSDDYCRDNEGNQETAVYTWEWDGDTLSMTTEKDDCTSRRDTVAEMTPAE